MEEKELKALTKSLLKLKKGNVNALENIYNSTYKGVFSFVLPIMRTREKAEDIAQNTFIHVYENIDKFDETKNPLNWILTISKNLALTEVKKDNKEISTDFMESVNGDRVISYDSDEFDTPILDIANRILSPIDLQIVMMYIEGEYKHREISEILGIPLGTVTWKYNNALKKIKTEYEKNGR